jgi:hypothetical protein
LGYDGWLLQGDDVLLTRPAGVRLGPGGQMSGTVTALMALEDGARVEVTVAVAEGRAASGESPRGVVYTVVPWPAPELGSVVSVEITAAARFPARESGPGPV